MKTKKTSVLLGTVVRIDCKTPQSFAEVKLRKRGRKGKAVKIEVRRLLAIGAAYPGAKFLYTVTDVGAERTIVITLNDKD